jgi:excisionase family DNA binding protein
MIEDKEKYITPAELAGMLRVSIGTVYSWLPSIPHLKVRRKILISETLFREWQRNQAKSSLAANSCLLADRSLVAPSNLTQSNEGDQL